MSVVVRVIVGVVATSLVLLGCTPGSSPSPSPSASESPPPEPTPLTLFYVAIGDDGVSGEPFGCGDSLVSIETEPVATNDVLRASMERLLSDTDREIGESGLMTALAEGTLSYVSGSVEDSLVTVELTGEPAPAGECDDPRIIEQLEGTALAATGATDVRILVDGVPIRDVLSLR